MSIAWAFPLSLLQRLMQELGRPFLGLLLQPLQQRLMSELECLLNLFPGFSPPFHQSLMQELECPFLGLFLHPSLHGLSFCLQTSRVNHHYFLKMWSGVAIVRALDAQL